MGELEAAGYLFQPHTSAGRVPTEKGYQFYIDHCLAENAPSKRQEGQLKTAIDEHRPNDPERFKSLARAVAELAEASAQIAAIRKLRKK